jgi:putative flippase GtrA
MAHFVSSNKMLEGIRYIINGLFATAVHYGVLTFNITFLKFESAGIANFVAALFGITISYIGNRVYVFRSRTHAIFSEMLRFLVLYLVIALCHGVVLSAWTDWQGWDYRWGFLAATCMQVCLSYCGNKILVFKS